MITTSSNPATAATASAGSTMPDTATTVTTGAGSAMLVTATTATAAMSDTATTLSPVTSATGPAPFVDTAPGDHTASREDGGERRLGYIRVSTREQNEARQVDALNQFGVDKVYMDKQSGKDFARPAYCQLLTDLKEGDVLVVKSIDRLGRNYEEILAQWRLITKTKGAAIVVLDMPLLDTRNSRDLTGTLIADIVLQLLSYVAETERNFIHTRQAEGIAAAKARGVIFGRPAMQRPEGYRAVVNLWREKAISANEAGRRLGVGRNTFLRWARMDAAHASPDSGNDPC